MRDTILPYDILLTRAHRAVDILCVSCGQYEGQGVYCGVRTASEVPLSFYYPTTFTFMQL